MAEPDQFDLPEEAGSGVQVAVRVRPMNKREIRNNCRLIVKMDGKTTHLVHPDAIDEPDFEKQEKKSFVYDYSYFSFGDRPDMPMHTQTDLFRDIGTGILDNAYKGYNCTLLAYGQTGSGKSFSMMGGNDEMRGLIPRICEAIFQQSQANTDPNMQYKVEVSYLEIYSERIRDLLTPNAADKPALKVREHPQTGPYVEDLTKCAVNSYDELAEHMVVGNKERTVAATNMNDTSSRSHAVFTVIFTQTRFDEVTKMSTDKVSKLQLVDLAGSERADSTGATGVRLQEAANINKSLSTLGMVISALAKLSQLRAQGVSVKEAGGGTSGPDSKANSSKRKTMKRKTMAPGTNLADAMAGGGEDDAKIGDDKSVFVPYRNSVLTWLLKDSLGGNSKTVMIAAISPADINYDETLSTLRYAARAKKIVNKAVVNEDPNAKIIRCLRKEIEDLKAALQRAGGTGDISNLNDEELKFLKEQLSQSEKIILDINRSWESKLEETRKLATTRIQELASKGVATQFDENIPFLVNLNEDPAMSESLIYYLKEGVTAVGHSPVTINDLESDEVPPHIVLSGLSILDNHCIFINEKETKNVYVEPSIPEQNPDLFVNGERVTERRQLWHGDRVIIGNNHVFRYSQPAKVLQEKTREMMAQRKAAGLANGGAGGGVNVMMGAAPGSGSVGMLVQSGSYMDRIQAGGADGIVGNARIFGMQQPGLAASRSGLNITGRHPDRRHSLGSFDIAKLQSAGSFGGLGLAPQQAMAVSASGAGGAIDWDFAQREKMAAQGKLQVLPENDQLQESYRLLAEKLAILEMGSAQAPGVEEKQRQFQELLTKHKANEELQQLVDEAKIVDDEKKGHSRAKSVAESAARKQMKAAISEALMKTLPLVDEANAMIQALGKKAKLDLELVTQSPEGSASVFGLSPLQRLRNIKDTLIQIRVSRGPYSAASNPSRPSIWSEDVFMDRLFQLREMYNAVQSGEDTSQYDDPLAPEELEMQLIGKAYIYLESVRYGVGVHQRTPILDHRGDYVGLLTVQLHCTDKPFDEFVSFSTADDEDFDAKITCNSPDKVQKGAPRTPDRKVVEEPLSPMSPITPMIGAQGSDDDEDLRAAAAHDPSSKRNIRLLRYKTKLPESVQPVVDKPLPVYLRVVRAERLPAVGCKHVLVKYQFGSERTWYSTNQVSIVKGKHVRTHSMGIPIRRKERTFQPVQFKHEMRHDVPAVNQKFVQYLQNDAIVFEVWGEFYTGEPENEAKFLADLAALEEEERKEKENEDKSNADKSKTETERRHDALMQRTSQPLSKPSDDAKSTSALAQREVPQASDDTVTRKGSVVDINGPGAEMEDKRKYSLFCAVDVEEMVGSGYEPCNVSAKPRVPPINGRSHAAPCVFRVSSAANKPKRFVITIIQSDSADFILESCASAKIEKVSRKVKGATSEKGFPVELNVWEQNYQIQHKLISIMANWPPELMQISDERTKISVKFSLQLYLSRISTPITLHPTIELEIVNDTAGARALGALRLYRSLLSKERLPSVGQYYQVNKEGVEDVVSNIFQEHQKQLSKLEHNMRIEQVQQHGILLKSLQVVHPELVAPCQESFDKSIDTIQKLRQRTALEGDQSQVERKGKKGAPISVSVTPVLPDELILRNGYLEKRGGGFNKAWKRRYFVLQPPFLYYYKQKDSDNVKGVIDLVGAYVKLMSNTDYGLEIHSPHRVWYLRAANEEDMNGWIQAVLEFNDGME